MRLFLACAFLMVFASVSFADDAKPMPLTPDTEADESVTVFGKGGRGDKGLKPIDPPKFDLPKPDVTVGVRVVAWGVAIAGVLIGLFVAAVIVVAALKFLRTVAVPAAAAESSLFHILDVALDRLESRREAMLKELGEINQRLKRAPRKTTRKRR